MQIFVAIGLFFYNVSSLDLSIYLFYIVFHLLVLYDLLFYILIFFSFIYFCLVTCLSISSFLNAFLPFLNMTCCLDNEVDGDIWQPLHEGKGKWISFYQRLRCSSLSRLVDFLEGMLVGLYLSTIAQDS